MNILFPNSGRSQNTISTFSVFNSQNTESSVPDLPVDQVQLSVGLTGTTNQVGDLIPSEIKKIQDIVDETKFPIVIIGSAAESRRRNVGSDLPIKKGKEGKSDIDYFLPLVSGPRKERMRGRLFVTQVGEQLKSLPDLDGVLFTGLINKPDPRIWFIPEQDPVFVPADGEDPLPKLQAPIEVPDEVLEQKIPTPVDLVVF